MPARDKAPITPAFANYSVIAGFAILVAIIVAGAWGLENRKKKALVDAGAEIAKVIESDATTLDRKNKELCIPDDYGIVDERPWDKETIYYWVNKVRPSISAHHYEAFTKEGSWSRTYRRMVDEAIQRVRSQREPSEEFDSNDPCEYEEFCAEQLRVAGWDARTTGRSRDFGADVIAKHGNRTLVLECKLHSAPIGSPTVKKTVGARTHYRANLAAVVSSSGFTNDAKKAGRTTGVHLLHHEELREWARKATGPRLLEGIGGSS